MIKEFIAWLDDVIVHDLDYNDVTNGKSEIVAVFHAIYNSVQNNADNENFYSRFIYNDDIEEHLPVPVYSYIRPTMGTHFILHIMLSLGRY